MPGHKVILQDTEKSREGLTCTYCQLILNDPVQTSESGLRFCKDCFEKGKSESLPLLDPNDNAWPDSAVKKEIANLKVFCNNCRDGCDWNGQLKGLRKHLSTCEFVKVECKNDGCGEQVLKRSLEDHMQNKCEYRKDHCLYCKKQLPFLQLKNHVKECPDAPATCDNCEKQMRLSQLSNHKANECNHIKCCGKVFEMESPEHMSHLQDANLLARHLIILFKKASKSPDKVSKEKVAELDSRIGYLVSKNESLENEMILLKKSNEELRKSNQDLHETLQQKMNGSAMSDTNVEKFFQKKASHIDERFRTISADIDDVKERLESSQVVSKFTLSSEHGTLEKPDFEFGKQLEEKVLEVERTLNVLSVHHSELELQLQASLASTHNGAFLWRIPEVRRRIRDAKIGRITSIYSPPFYTGRNGYKMCIRAYLNGDGNGENTHLSVFFVLMKGEYDPLLQWPFESKVSLILVDQEHKKHMVQTFKPNPQSSSFQKPKSDMNVASGCPEFAQLSILENPSYVKDDVMYIKAIVDTTKIFHP